MNDFSRQPLVEQAWPCAFCWGKRIKFTTATDEQGRPICGDCNGRTQRTQYMPSFVLNDILEIRND